MTRTASPPSDVALLANPKRLWSLTGLCLAAAIVWFAAANLPVATPVIAAGRFGDIFGRRKVLDLGLVLFAVASVVAALAQGPAMLIAGRALMGVAAAAILPATLAIIPIELNGKEEVTAFSV